MHELTTQEQRDAFIDKFDSFLFDCDGKCLIRDLYTLSTRLCTGVLWEGTKLIARVDEAMRKLRSKGKQMYFVTNNSTKSRDSFLKKLRGFGIDAELVCLFPIKAYRIG